MINGAHIIIYSRNADADRAFLRDVLRIRHVDVGDGWLIFALPPSEMAVHPSRRNGVHELYFLCRDVRVFVAAMARKGIECGPIQTMSWGRLTEVTLPGGGTVGVYQPKHARPTHARARVPATDRPARKRTARAA